MGTINIQIYESPREEANWGYHVDYVEKGIVQDRYQNNAQKIDEFFILTENNEKPLCITSDRNAADQALYCLAKQNAEKKLKKATAHIRLQDFTQD